MCGSCLLPNRAQPSWICSAILGSVAIMQDPDNTTHGGSTSATTGEMVVDMLDGRLDGASLLHSHRSRQPRLP
jgi:hypothetical protein